VRLAIRIAMTSPGRPTTQRDYFKPASCSRPIRLKGRHCATARPLATSPFTPFSSPHWMMRAG